MFEWNPQLDTGIAAIDHQHRRLVGLLARLFKAMQDGAGSEVLEEILSGLEEYTREHFATEEQLMARHAYPEAASHSQAHELFRHKLAQLGRQSREQHQGVLSIQVILFLRSWLTEHIGSVDQEFSQFLLERGAA